MKNNNVELTREDLKIVPNLLQWNCPKPLP